MSHLLDKVIARKILAGCRDREAALVDIARTIDMASLWQAAKLFGVLVEESAEEFALQFYPAFNDEVYLKY